MSVREMEDRLLSVGLVTPEQLRSALELQKKKGGELGNILMGMGMVSEESFMQFLASQIYGLPYYSLSELMQFTPKGALLRKFPYEIAFKYLVLPLKEELVTQSITLIASAPLPRDQELELLTLVNREAIFYYLATRENLQRAIHYHYAQSVLEQSSQSSGNQDTLPAMEGFQMETAVSDELLRSSQDLGKSSTPAPAKGRISLTMMTPFGAKVFQKENLCSSCGFPHEINDSFCSRCGHILGGSSTDPFVGKIIGGKWELLSSLGEGGMGMVYKAQNHETQQFAAIKLLDVRLQMDNEAIDRFYMEAQASRRLQHPHIIELYDFGFEEKLGFYIIMELLEGCDLDEYMSQVAEKGELIPTLELCRILSQVCDAMDYAHERSVVHRDLKPNNIFLVGGGGESFERVKILDFGIAKIVGFDAEHATSSGAFLGTPRYLSPEQAKGEVLDFRTDIYSLSVILYECLTGDLLFKAEGPYQYIMCHVYSEIPSLREIRSDKNYSGRLERLVTRGLAKEPEDRPSSMNEYRNLLISAMKDGIQDLTSTSELTHFVKSKEEEPISGMYRMQYDEKGPSKQTPRRLEIIGEIGTAKKFTELRKRSSKDGIRIPPELQKMDLKSSSGLHRERSRIRTSSARKDDEVVEEQGVTSHESQEVESQGSGGLNQSAIWFIVVFLIVGLWGFFLWRYLS